MNENPDTVGSVTEISLGPEFTVIRSETPIGYIEPLGEYQHIIGHIETVEEERGNGYGKAATKSFIERAAQNGANVVETSVVISPAFEHILRELGFSETAHEEPGLYFSKQL